MSRAQARVVQAGSTGIGLMIGLIIGLLVAVLVAIFVTKAPVPFVNKAPKQPDSKAADAKAPSEPIDPNKALQGKSAGKTPENPTGDKPSEAAQGEGKDSIFGLLGSLGKENLPAAKDAPKEVPKDATKDAGKAASKDAKPAESKATDTKSADAKPAEPDSTRYFLQAGAFRDRDEAETMKGKLALLGFEARLSTVERDGNTIYRVRTGPFKQLDDASGARKRLADGGVETSLVPIRQ
jgi:cell division protein FtsN